MDLHESIQLAESLLKGISGAAMLFPREKKLCLLFPCLICLQHATEKMHFKSDLGNKN